MNISTRLIPVGTIIGTLAVAGLARLVYASQTHAQAAVVLQPQHDEVKEQQESTKL